VKNIIADPHDIDDESEAYRQSAKLHAEQGDRRQYEAMSEMSASSRNEISDASHMYDDISAFEKKFYRKSSGGGSNL